MNVYSEDFRFENGVLYVRLSGEFPIEMLRETKNLFQPLIDACSTYKCKKALIDATDLEVDLSTMGLFRAGEDAVSLTLLGLRIAIVAREDMLDGFFEDVATNRGGDIRVFINMDDALAWLQS